MVVTGQEPPSHQAFRSLHLDAVDGAVASLGGNITLLHLLFCSVKAGER
jgi:hypothetical protein